MLTTKKKELQAQRELSDLKRTVGLHSKNPATSSDAEKAQEDFSFRQKTWLNDPRRLAGIGSVRNLPARRESKFSNRGYR